MATKKYVDFFYDVVSPYSWLAFEVLCRYQSSGTWNINLRLKPVFLGGIMQATGNKAPAMVPNKARYLHRDIDRLKELMNIPIKHPADFFGTVLDKGSLKAMRFVTALDMKHPDKTEDISRELWMRIWNRDEDITTPESFREAGKRAGLSDAVLEDAISRSKDQSVKDRLKQVTDEALSYGAFGVPAMVAHTDSGPDLFFGSDRFDSLAMVLGEQWKGHMPEMGVKSKL